MKNIKNLFSEIKTPESWKADLYAEIQKEENARRPVIKRFSTVISAAAAIAAVSITAAAVTGILDFGGILRNSFDDGISASKIETGDYQALDSCAENDIISLKASAFMGDMFDSYIILEARLKDSAKNDFSRLGLEVKVYDNTVSDGNNYVSNIYYGVPEKDENGETVYIFKVKTLPYWVEEAVENGGSLLLDVRAVVFETSEDSQIRETADMQISFAPDENILDEYFDVEPNREMNINGEICIAERFIPSDYAARLVLAYTVPYSIENNGETVTDLWRIGGIYGRKIINAPKNETEFSADLCPIKLVVDGNVVPYIGKEFNGIERPYEIMGINDEIDGSFKLTNSFICVLSFEPFDFENAESVVIEIENTSGETEHIIIK